MVEALESGRWTLCADIDVLERCRDVMLRYDRAGYVLLFGC